MSSLPDSSCSRATALRGDEKMASRGCMPCSSRSPVSFKKAPVFLFSLLQSFASFLPSFPFLAIEGVSNVPASDAELVESFRLG